MARIITFCYETTRSSLECLFVCIFSITHHTRVKWARQNTSLTRSLRLNTWKVQSFPRITRPSAHTFPIHTDAEFHGECSTLTKRLRCIMLFFILLKIRPRKIKLCLYLLIGINAKQMPHATSSPPTTLRYHFEGTLKFSSCENGKTFA